jgi:hypothetical protein
MLRKRWVMLLSLLVVMTWLLSLSPEVSIAQELDQENEICFSIPDSQKILRGLKERDILMEEVTLLKDSLNKRDEAIKSLEEKTSLLVDKITLLDQTIKNREELIADQTKALDEAKTTIINAKELIKKQEGEIKKAKFFGFAVGGAGIAIAILALISVL